MAELAFAMLALTWRAESMPRSRQMLWHRLQLRVAQAKSKSIWFRRQRACVNKLSRVE